MFSIPLQVPNADNIQGFGTLITTQNKIGEQTELFDWYGGIAEADFGETTFFGMVCPKFNPAFTVTEFEQHSQTQEALIPLGGDIIVVLAKENAFNCGEICKEDFAAFLIRQGEGLLIHKKIWHKAPLTFSEQSQVLVMFKRGTSETDNIPRSLKEYREALKIML